MEKESESLIATVWEDVELADGRSIQLAYPSGLFVGGMFDLSSQQKSRKNTLNFAGKPQKLERHGVDDVHKSKLVTTHNIITTNVIDTRAKQAFWQYLLCFCRSQDIISHVHQTCSRCRRN